MKNKNRLIISLTLIFILWFIGGFGDISFGNYKALAEVIFTPLLLSCGIWLLIEGVIFVKNRENRNSMPLVLMALFIALYALFVGAGLIAAVIFDLVEGGPFQTIGYFLFFIALILFPILGVWAIIKGIIMIRDRTNVKLGIINLIVGAITSIPALVSLIGLLISLIRGPSSYTA